jgi:hypothetical protein
MPWNGFAIIACQGSGLAVSRCHRVDFVIIAWLGSGLAMSRCHGMDLLLLQAREVALLCVDAMEWVCYYCMAGEWPGYE